MIKVTNTGVLSGVSVEDLRENLRLPSGMDDMLLETILAAVVNMVEEQTGRCLISKTVKEIFVDNNTRIRLKYPAAAISSVKLNSVDQTDDQCTKVIDVTPSIVILHYALSGINTVEVNYTSVGEVTPSLRNLVMAISSQYYNNPEGLGAIDQSRINALINMHIGL